MHPRRALALVAVLTATWSGSPARAQSVPDNVEDRLRRLEATVDSLKQENAELRRQLGTTAAAPAGKSTLVLPTAAGHETRLVLGGFMHAQAEFGDEGDSRFAGAADRFYFRRARLYLAGAFAEHFEFKIEGEFGANSITPATGLRAMANEVWVGWNRFPIANLRFGQLKPAFGGEQLQAETKSPTVERYLGNDRLTDSRQVGMSIGGDLIPQRLSYLIVLGNGNGSNVSANDNSKFLQTGRLAGVPFESASFGRLTLGVNAMRSDDGAVNRPGFGFRSGGTALDNVFAGKRTGWGADAMWHRGPLDLTAEFLRMEFQPRNRLPQAKFNGAAWELMATYFVVPNTLQAVIRRESFDPNTSLLGDQTNNWVLGLNYLIHGDDLKLLVDYMFGHNADRPDDRGRLLTRFQLVF